MEADIKHLQRIIYTKCVREGHKFERKNCKELKRKYKLNEKI